ncbi:hypothetical protein [Flavobacterium sp. MK4S-17]|jgi:uncharacterized HAD superfamily protein|uniref:hypothetical protein n=1 Tax=Flavobacterium sp. MK4S-17 TaxID=2543737 RepID=UPI001357964E|nr:hypothetical protein [Flavobacterium sp. MK4S-17]
MQLTEDNIEYISNNLDFYGIIEPELKEDLLDHICTYIENDNFNSFESAYQEAVQKFGGQYAIGRIQHQTFIMVSLQSKLKRKRVLYITGYLTGFFISTGSIFKIMHWPVASILIVLGFITFNFTFLPLFFYHWYKNSMEKQYSNH